MSVICRLAGCELFWKVPADPTQQGLALRVPGFPEAFPDSRFSTLCCQCLESRTSPRGSNNAGPGLMPKGLQAVGDWTHTAVEGCGEQRHQRPQMSRSMHHGSLGKGDTGQANRSKCRESVLETTVLRAGSIRLRSTSVRATVKL